MAKKKNELVPDTEMSVEQESFALPGDLEETSGHDMAGGQETAEMETQGLEEPGDDGSLHIFPEEAPHTFPGDVEAGEMFTNDLAPTPPEFITEGEDTDPEDGWGQLEQEASPVPVGENNRSFGDKLDIELELERQIAALENGAAVIPEPDSEDQYQATPEPEESGENGESPAVTTVLAKPVSKVPATRTGQMAGFFQTDFKRLDKNLSEPEKEEWNAIYASYRSKSILTGTVIGVDQNELPIRNKETGQNEIRVIHSLVIVGYRVKILIPENEVWANGEERGVFLMRSMIGATVDYVIINVDREGECALASRGAALIKRRRAFAGARIAPKAGDMLKCSVLAVGPKRCIVTCGGYDIPLRVQDMSYTPILDMRVTYRTGQKLDARLVDYRPGEHKLFISVKEARPNPFEGAQQRHPIGSRRQAVICGKYAGGVFCTLPDDTVCLCLYSNALYDTKFLLGDNVIIHIVQYDYRNRFIFGRIVSKW